MSSWFAAPRLRNVRVTDSRGRELGGFNNIEGYDLGVEA